VGEETEALYREGRGVRAVFGTDQERALTYYADLVEFVTGVAGTPREGRPGRLLDVGCGSGWSTLAFARAGFEATGIDLNPRAFEPAPEERLDLREGSAVAIQFPADSFDLVVCYQCLEHVSDPRRALDEVSRVCRPGGVVMIVGPNLMSPVTGLVYISKPSSWSSLRFRRTPHMPRHPYGNTVPEVLATAVVRTGQLAAKLLSSDPSFTMRDADDVPPFHSDNDACYLCNPTDLIAYFRRRGFRIERRGRPGRPWPLYLLAGGTWIAARKAGKQKGRQID
jgi:SAM-dependent methyltransferase